MSCRFQAPELKLMNIIFRTDASLEIGTGHVMRCLTLADALKDRGTDCQFICREHQGNLLEFIRERGFKAHVLPMGSVASTSQNTENGTVPAHVSWLGADWKIDAEQTLSILGDVPVDWFIVDHYALDERWEGRLRPICKKLMVIDDLADRIHDCDLLLDQNLGREVSDYADLVPKGCTVLVGSYYALLRSEFAALRDYSLSRRKIPQLKQLLITMGGVDKDDATSQVLEALKQCNLPEDCRINVVMGANAPWLDRVRTFAADMPWSTEVVVNVRDMATLMAGSDLAIGAAGGTSLERLCLGLPTLLMILSENQRPGAEAMEAEGSVFLLGDIGFIGQHLASKLGNLLCGDNLRLMQQSSSALVDGHGAGRIVNHLMDLHD